MVLITKVTHAINEENPYKSSNAISCAKPDMSHLFDSILFSMHSINFCINTPKSAISQNMIDKRAFPKLKVRVYHGNNN